jgi:hypothetical protein
VHSLWAPGSAGTHPDRRACLHGPEKWERKNGWGWVKEKGQGMEGGSEGEESVGGEGYENNLKKIWKVLQTQKEKRKKREEKNNKT